MLKTYEDAIQYLYSNLPIFQRVGSVAFKPSLKNTITLCEAFDNPQHKFKTIHVGGTNGKGSTSHMLASIFQESGYRTGLYTSPHLKDFTERIRINGNDVDKQFVVDFVNRVQPLIEKIQPSFFEITVVMAFEYFAQQKVDVTVIEVGLGGRLDSTNVIHPILSVITNIGWDHVDLLGDTLDKIANEKAGIIKSAIPVVISERQPETENVFIDKAKSENAPISFASDAYHINQVNRNGKLLFTNANLNSIKISDIEIPLQGNYQRKNLGGVLQSVEVLRTLGFSLPDEMVIKGLQNIVINTNLKGRWQKLGEKPLTICDTGHNVDGMKEIISQMKSISFNKLHFVLGMVKDKDITKVLSLLPTDAAYYFCQAKIPRALDAKALADDAAHFNLNGLIIPDVNAALEQAKQLASEDDMIFIGGSTFVVAEIENL